MPVHGVQRDESAAAARQQRQNRELTAIVRRERARLLRGIRRYVADRDEAEDILQEVFGELIETYRLVSPLERPIGQLGAWLARVARRRIIDRFRRRRRFATGAAPGPTADSGSEVPGWEQLLPDPAAGVEAAYLRAVLLETLQAALQALPPEQRSAFLAHELGGEGFRAMSARTGVALGTLLSRKHQAVRFLRARLLAVHDAFREL